MIFAYHFLKINGQLPYAISSFNTSLSIFFAMSGFMMVWCYSTCTFNLECKGAYMVRRIARLWPPLMVSWIWGVFIENSFAWSLPSLSILPVPLMILSATICHHGVGRFEFLWAVSAEFLCYVAFALVAPYLRRWYLAATQPNASSLVQRSFWIVLPTVCYLSTLIPNVIFAATMGPASQFFNCNLLFTFWARAPTFFLGAWSGYLALHFLHPAWQRASEHEKARVGTIIDVSLVSIGVLVLWGLRMFDDAVGTTLSLMSHKETFAPLTVFVILAFSLDTGRIAKCLSWGPMLILGEISYEVYILHPHVAETFKCMFSTDRYLFISTLPITIAVSYILQRYFSAPVFSWMTAAATRAMPSLACKCSKQPATASVYVPITDSSCNLEDSQHSSISDDDTDTTRLLNQA